MRDQQADPGAHSRCSLKPLYSFLGEDPENTAGETEEMMWEFSRLEYSKCSLLNVLRKSR